MEKVKSRVYIQKQKFAIRDYENEFFMRYLEAANKNPDKCNKEDLKIFLI